MLNTHTLRWPFRFHRISAGERAIGGVALATSILAGSTFNGFSKDLSSYVSPLSLLFVSELLALLFVFLSFGVLPTIKNLVHLKKKEAIALLGIGAISGVCGPLLWFTGVKLTTAINAGFFSRTELIFLLLFAHTFLHEKIARAHITAMASILIGIVIIATQSMNGLALQLGDVFVIGAACSYAIGHIIYRKFLTKTEPHLALLARSAAGIGTFFVVSPFIEHPFIEEIYALPKEMVFVLLGFAFIARFLNNISFYEAVERLSITTISVVFSLSVVGSTLFAYLYLGEQIQWYHYLGGSFIILGTILLELLRTHPKSPHATDPEHTEQRLKQRVIH